LPLSRRTELPALYGELAEWWPLLSAPSEYAEEAEFYRRTIVAASETTPRTILELGCGGGNNASHLKKYFQMTLVDLSPAMLNVSRALNAECEHVVGDMRSVRLDRQFDAVFIHDAICYLRTEADLALAIETAFVHCAPGGVALFAPDCSRETFKADTEHGGHDAGDRGLRYLSWTFDPDPTDSTYRMHMVYLLRQGAAVRCVVDPHECGLFAYADWMRLVEQAGFEASSTYLVESEVEPETVPVFVGVKHSNVRERRAADGNANG
jgi:SAM-dependent methyltransferase